MSIKKKAKAKLLSYFKILGGGSKRDINTIIVYAIVSAIANAVLISILNAAADSVDDQSINRRLLFMFLLSMLIFYISKRYILREATRMTEKSIFRIRVEVIDLLRKAELRVLEQIGKSTIYTRITQDANFISQTSALIINAFQSAILVFFSLIYIAYISLPAFFITVVSVTISSIIYLSKQKEINEEIRIASKKETELFDSLGQILEGFKELKMNHKKNNDLNTQFHSIAEESQDFRIATGLRFAVGSMFSQTVFYVLIGLVVFVLPQYSELGVSNVTKLTATILFIMGPLESIVGAIPLFFKANMAIADIDKLKSKLLKKIKKNSIAAASYKFHDFKTIKVENLKFAYRDKDKDKTFEIGPINVELQRNKLYIIKGGNGSGKSSFLKLFTGLYKPDSGAIEVDGHKISKKEYYSYRELFSIIFTDFYLFDRFYGLKDVDPEQVNYLLKKFNLDRKTSYVNGAFTNRDLSTGQKKRLALIVALLEDKPVYIFDEVAADQDPGFRAYFYTEFLNELKEKGKTIIFVSHDDNYYDVADEIFAMVNGQLIKE